MSIDEITDYLKIWLVSISTFLIKISEVMNSILTSISLILAITYTSYKLYLSYKQNKKKKNESK
jgi:hypothetical protein